MSYFNIIGYGNIPAASPAEIRAAVEELAPSLIDEKMGDYAKKDDVETTLEGYATKGDISGFIDRSTATQIASTTTSQQISRKQEDGEMNDIRVFPSFADFDANGVEGVEYVDSSTGVEYIWKDSDGKYHPINDVLSRPEIDEMFN